MRKLENVKVASQAYVDKQIEGNKTKITSVAFKKEEYNYRNLKIDDAGKVIELDDEEKRKEIANLIISNGLYIKASKTTNSGYTINLDHELESNYLSDNPNYFHFETSNDANKVYFEIITYKGDENYLKIVVDSNYVLSRDNIEILRINNVPSEEIFNFEDAEDVVPSMKYTKDTYRRKDDLTYGNTSLALEDDVVELVEDSKKFVSAENFTSQIIETVGDALADDADLKSAIEKAIDNVASNMDNLVSKNELENYLKVSKVKGEQSTEENAVYSAVYSDSAFAPTGHDHDGVYMAAGSIVGEESESGEKAYSAAYMNKQLADIADNFSDIDKDKSKYRLNSDFKYDNNGVEETIAFQSYVDSKFMDDDKEKYALAGHDHSGVYVGIENVERAEDDEDKPLKIPTVEKVTNMLAGYVKEERVIGYTKGEGSPADSPEDEDISSRTYSLPTMKKVSSMIADSLSPGGGSTFVTSTTLTETLDGKAGEEKGGYVKKASVVDYNKEEEPSAGQVYGALTIKSILERESLTSAVISPAKEETVSESTKLPSTGRAKEIANDWFDENYEVVE